MKNLKSRMLFMFFAFMFSLVYGNYDVQPIAKERWIGCIDEAPKRNISIAYLSKTYVDKFEAVLGDYGLGIHDYDEFKNSKNYDVVNDLLSVCLCRSNFDPITFVVPYSKSNGDDVIAVCVIGDNGFTTMGIFDDEELYDYLMLKHQELIPASIIDPLLYSSNVKYSKCYDLDHYPTKAVMGQETCLFFAVSESNFSNIYSGSLLSLPLINFDKDMIMDSCHTTLKDTTSRLSDFCYYHHTLTKSMFACCCPNNPKSCISPIKKEKHLYCFAGKIKNSVSLDETFEIEEYFNNYYKPACTTKITAFFNNNKISIWITYNATDSCLDTDDGLISAESEKFCSDEKDEIMDKTFSKTMCCNNSNLCNYELIPSELNTDATMEMPALYELLNLSCDSYLNLGQFPSKMINLYDGFNAKLLHETRRSFNNITYIIAKIIKSDSDECEKPIITEEHLNKYFIFFNCGKNECSENVQNDLKSFKCEESEKPGYGNALDTWFCYVQMKPKNFRDFDIEAGYLKIKKPSECYSKNLLNETYCCVNVFEQAQNETECTMEKMKERYKKYLKALNDPSHNLPDSMRSFTQCIQRDTGIEENCPGNDGCFETRSLSESDSSKVLEPAGCLGNAEKYTVENLPLTSLSLGCRVDENSNRCSIVQTPEGEQRIVCCCQEKENEFCSTKIEKLSKQIGKPISSFKGL